MCRGCWGDTTQAVREGRATGIGNGGQAACMLFMNINIGVMNIVISLIGLHFLLISAKVQILYKRVPQVASEQLARPRPATYIHACSFAECCN